MNATGLQRIKLGRGVVGKLTSALLGLFAVLAVVAYGLTGQPYFLAGLAAVAVGVFWYFAKTVVSFAERNPDQALLEGAEVLAYKRIEMAAKGISPPANSPMITAPSAAPSLPTPPVRE